MVWNFRLCFSTMAISNSFSSDPCARQDLSVRAQLHKAEPTQTGSINMRVALIKESERERTPISLLYYNLWRSKGLSAGINLWPWDSCWSVQCPHPNTSERALSRAPMHFCSARRFPGPWRALEGTHPAARPPHGSWIKGGQTPCCGLISLTQSQTCTTHPRKVLTTYTAFYTCSITICESS